MSASVATKTVKPPKPLPPPNSDFYEVYETLAPDELATVKRVRTFMEAKVEPVITKYWVDDAFPFELLPGVKELGIGGLGMNGYDCAGGSLALLGFVLMEIARIDPSFATPPVQGSTAVGARNPRLYDAYVVSMRTGWKRSAKLGEKAPPKSL